MLHIPPTNLLLQAAKQEPYKKAYLLTKKTHEVSGKSSEGRTSRQKKDKTERATGRGRRTREVIAKWNQMTALRFQTGGKTSDIPGLLSGRSATIKPKAPMKRPTTSKSYPLSRSAPLHFLLSLPCPFCFL